ncbi:MAG: hypothetical protein ABL932_09825 [Terricaulis sp.]
MFSAAGLAVMGIVAMLNPESRFVGYLLLVVGAFYLLRDLAPKFWGRL